MSDHQVEDHRAPQRKRAYVEEFARILSEKYQEILDGPSTHRLPPEKGRELAEIGQALERIRYGIFGVCQECSEDIPHSRLVMAPAARDCGECRSTRIAEVA